MAKWSPIQDLGPCPKGRYCERLRAFDSAGLKRSGSDTAAADPPQHTRMRRIVSRGFTPPRIKDMASTISTIVGRCLEGIGEAPSFDAVERLAVPLPVEMICHIFGIDYSEYGSAKRWRHGLWPASTRLG